MINKNGVTWLSCSEGNTKDLRDYKFFGFSGQCIYNNYTEFRAD